MGYQNFFATKLFTDIGAADTTITLETAPTVTSGRLALEARNSSKREIIKYTGVSGNDITGVTRGQGGTTASTHVKNALVEMNVTAEDLSDAFAVPSDIVDKWDKTFVDYVQSGLVWSIVSGLNGQMTAGVAYVDGIKATFAAIVSGTPRAFTASKDTYIDVGNNGTIYYNEVANGAAQPAFTAGRIRIAVVTTNASAITYVTNYPNGNTLATDDGWNNRLLPAVNTVVANGQRNVTLTHASSVAAWISPGARRLFNRILPTNLYMGGLFNGTNHYFVKTTPTSTLSTVTDNFTFEVNHRPTAYGAQYSLMGRSDATPANNIMLQVTASGEVTFGIRNGGVGNTRSVTTAVTLPLNRSTHIAASWASGTVVIYFDGIAQPLRAVVTGGTAPTTAGTAGDFAIGRHGAFNGEYATGYISNAAVFNAVLTGATIKTHMTIRLLGTETNCIGAWSLDNTAVNQQAPGTNDLTATNSVGYSTGVAPYGNNGVSAITEYGITMSLSADGLTEVVQYPEGCAIPDGSATIQSSSFSYERSPLGFPSDKNKWALYLLIMNTSGSSGTTVSTWYNPGGLAIWAPIGRWLLSASLACQFTNTSTTFDNQVAVSLANNAVSVGLMDAQHRDYMSNYTAGGGIRLFKPQFSIYIEPSAITAYYVLVSCGAAVSAMDIRGANTGSSPSFIRLDNSYL